LVIDYLLDQIGLLKEPLVCTISKGRVIDVTGDKGQVEELKQIFGSSATIDTLRS